MNEDDKEHKHTFLGAVSIGFLPNNLQEYPPVDKILNLSNILDTHHLL